MAFGIGWPETDRVTHSRLESSDVVTPCILGIDPGLGITGYGVLEIQMAKPVLREAGIIRCEPRTSLESRLKELHDGIVEVIQSHSIVALRD